jgi:hypothetical protein
MYNALSRRRIVGILVRASSIMGATTIYVRAQITGPYCKERSACDAVNQNGNWTYPDDGEICLSSGNTHQVKGGTPAGPYSPNEAWSQCGAAYGRNLFGFGCKE